MAGKKGKKTKTKARPMPLGEFLGALGGGGPDATIVSAPKIKVDADDQEEIVGTEHMVLPTCPRTSRGPHVDPDTIPTTGPFTAHVANLPFEVDDYDITQFFKEQNILAIRLPMDRDGARSKGYGYIEFATRQDLIDSLQQHEEMIRGRKIRVDLPENEGGDRPGGYGRREGGRYSDRTEGGMDREERSLGVGDWRTAPKEVGGGEFEKPERSGGGDRDGDRGSRYGGGGFSDKPRNDDDPWRRGGGDSGGGGGFEDRRGGGFEDRRGGGGFEDRRGGGGFEDRHGGGGGGFEDRGSRGGYDDRRSGYDDRRGGGGGFGDRDRRGGGGGYEDRYSGGGGFERMERRTGGGGGEDDTGKERPKLNLKPRTVAGGRDESPSATAAGPKDTSEGPPLSIFGSAKPVDTASREKKIEERFSKKSPVIARREDKPASADIFGAAKPVDTSAREKELEKRIMEKSPSTVKKDVSSRPAAADIFGAAKPVDTLAREMEIEEKLRNQPISALETPGKGDTWRDRAAAPRRDEREIPSRRDDRDRRGGDDYPARRDDRDRRDDRRGGGGRFDRDDRFGDDRRFGDRGGRPGDRAPAGDRFVESRNNGYTHKGSDNRNDRSLSSHNRNGHSERAARPAPAVERPAGYDSDEERFKRAQPKETHAVTLEVKNFSELNLEEDLE